MEDYNISNDIDAILPDGFNPEDKDFSLDKLADLAPITETQPAEPTANNEPAPAEQPAEPEPTTVQEPSEPVPQPQTVKIKYNHEEHELSLEEAATLAQKGMNYDKLNERVQGFEAANARNERLAKLFGYSSVDEMMTASEKNFYDHRVRDLVDAGNTEAMARFLVDQEIKATSDAAQTTPAPTQSEPPTQTRPPQISPERKAEFDEFAQAYPKVFSIPNEVWAANRNGVRLKDAYENYLAKQAISTASQQVTTSAPAVAPQASVNTAPVADPTKAQLERAQAELQILKQNQAAAAKAPVGGVSGLPSIDPPKQKDPFEIGFDSEDYYTEK